LPSGDIDNLLGGGSMVFAGGYWGIGGGYDYSPGPENISGTFLGMGFGAFAFGGGYRTAIANTGITW
jgi:hypothetical protein